MASPMLMAPSFCKCSSRGVKMERRDWRPSKVSDVCKSVALTWMSRSFEDPENTRKLQEQYPFGFDKFPVWSEHTSAIHQFIIWTALTNSGLGANLQHYNPLIDEKLQEAYNVPKTWPLVAQMVFGKPTAPPGPKPTGMKKPLSERLSVFGA